jgi:hypothetical protein
LEGQEVQVLGKNLRKTFNAITELAHQGATVRMVRNQEATKEAAGFDSSHELHS